MYLLASAALAASLAAPPVDGHAKTQADLVDTAVAAGSFETLATALGAAGLVDTLKGEGPFTVFAPTDEAFAALPQATRNALLRPENRDALVSVLTYHVVAGAAVSASDAVSLGRATTVQGAPVEIAIREGRLTVGGANVIANDVEASNGLIHVIDSVLLPPEGLQLAPQGRLVFGVFSERPSRALAAQLGLDRHATLVLTRIVAGSTAERDGLRAYDVVTSVAGKPASDETLASAKADAGAGGRVHFEVLRGGEPLTLDVEVGVETH